MKFAGRVIWRYSKANHNALCALGSSCERSVDLTPSDRIAPSPGDVICYSFRTSELEMVKEEVKEIREAYGGRVVLIAGGPHPSGDPYGTLELGFDKVFTGPCEEEMASFLRGEIPDDEGIITGRSFDISKYPISSDHLPLPRGIEISRGCPHGCRFCQVSYVFGLSLIHI